MISCYFLGLRCVESISDNMPSVSKRDVGRRLQREVVASVRPTGAAALLRVLFRLATGWFGRTPEAEIHCEREYVKLC